jgi:very-short-patch-repair endonuclease
MEDIDAAPLNGRAEPPPTLAARRARKREQMRGLAESQAGVLSRTQLYSYGVTRGEVRANVRAGRWRLLGSHCVCLHTGPLAREAHLWSAVLEGGPRAFLDGESALVAAGLRNFEPTAVRVSVPRGARIRHRGTSVDIRQTRRWHEDDLDPGPFPRTRVPVAAVRAARWARSDRQATLLMVMTVQQGLASAEELAVEMLRIRRDKRRGLLHGVLLDLVGGVGSLGELDVLRGCRERGIPEPDMQVLRRTRTGTYYLDFRWRRWKVALEVDGIQHTWVENVVGDALRQNTIAVAGDTVLRLPVLGLRVCPDQFFDQIAEALQRAGCPLPDRLSA